MATTDFDFNLTRQGIINAAFEKIGVLTPGQVLSGADNLKGSISLNLIIKEWRNKGIFLWQHEKFSLSTIASTTSYALSNNVISIDRAYYTQSVNNDVQISVISYADYLLIPDKASLSNTPTHIALDYNLTTPIVYIYPTPSAVVTVNYLAVKRLKDMDVLSGTPEIPPEYLNALIYDLAAELSDDYSLPLRERERLDNKAETKMFQAKKRNTERPTSNWVNSAFPERRRR